MSLRSIALSALVAAVCALTIAPTAQAAVGSPQPGEVYREFTIVMSNSSQGWRVTDPNTSNVNAQSELPNQTHTMNIPSSHLNGAVRAEMLFDYWGGHPGTVGQKFKFNSKPWINLPELSTTPSPATGNNRPECYMQQWNPVVTVPLTHLQAGTNVLHRTSGNQTCFSFNWGQWGSYAVTLRIYYDPASVANPTGSITSPGNGGTIGENPTINVSASGGGGIARVDVLARVEAYDWDGDGVYTDWGQAYHRAKTANSLDISHHVGTKTSGPFNFVFNTELIPDQAAGSVRFLARIKGSNGLWYVTPVKQNISLVRAGSVRLFKPKAVTSRFWTRVTRRNLTSKVNIPQSVDLNDVTSAKLLVRTWNGVDGGGPGTHSTKVNGWKIPGTYGANHHYSADVLTVQLNRLIHGDNIVTFDSPSTHHGVEILWPGPALLLRFGSEVASFCGDGTVDSGEECDDGNNNDGDGCDSDCTVASVATCGDGNVDPDEQCDDGNTNNTDGCLNDCTLPVQPSSLPALYPFEGTSSQVADASGNGNVGNLVGSAARTNDGRFGKALVFNGNSGHVNLGVMDVGGNQGTWAAYLRADDFGISDARILSKATSTANNDHYWMLSTFQQGALRHLRFRLKINGTTQTLIGTLGTLSAGQWIHAAATYDGSTIRLYQDGQLVASASASGPITGNSGVEAWIGDHVGGGKSFDGRIDEVLIDDQGRTAQEIADLMNGSVAGGPACGDGSLDSGEECDDGNTTDADGCQGDCKLPVCGDLIVDAGEECDDGNDTDGDGCQAACLLPVCGDGIVDSGETCDDGNDIDDDGCQTDCTSTPFCGDGTVDPGEACDDGNDVTGDGCEQDCTVTPFCGDGIVDPGEACDDGNDVTADGCEPDCTISPVCGDGIVDPGEGCDDGGNVDGDGCQANCQLPGCGDGVLDPGEACDDGNDVAADGCEPDCTISPVCGDGIVDPGEGCDDGGNVDGDGCQANCQLPVCGDGVLDSGETCDDGNNANGDGCQGNCVLPACGDGIVDAPTEQCDDGNNAAEDGCSADCQLEDDGGPPAAVSFFFNGEACTLATCKGTNGYTLDPVLEYSAGDDTADLVSLGRVTRAAALFGRYGFEATTVYDQMIYDIDDGDLLSSDRGAICMAVRRASTPAAAGHRLVLAHSPDATSYVSIDFRRTNSLRLSYRDVSRVLTRVHTAASNDIDTQDLIVIQASYDTTASTDSLRLLVNGVQLASFAGSVEPLDALSQVRFGNRSGIAGAHNYDHLLLSSDPDIDCWTELSGICTQERSRCMDDSDCPGADVCENVAENYSDLSGGGDGGPVDLCPDDPEKDEPGICGCGVADGTLDDQGNVTCGVDSELTFFFNGEACTSSACSGAAGYSLDPDREFSVGDTTASFNSRGAISAAGAIFGQRGFEATTAFDQMKFDVSNEDLINSSAGSICMIVQNQGVPAVSQHRLLQVNAPSATSLIALEYAGTDDLRLLYRDVDGNNRSVHSGSWNGADSPDAMLLQVVWDSFAPSGGLRLIVDGVERIASSAGVQPLGAISQLRFGNSSSKTGAFRYDQLLISERANLDCWDLIAGTCDANPATRCIDDSDCPGADTCESVTLELNQLR